MATENDLVLALEFVTEGAKAAVPQTLARAEFSTESFVAETRKIQKKARPWTQGRGIQGVGIGEKISDGKVSGDELALRVYVEKKKPKSKIKNPVPSKLPVPEIGDVTTDVVEIGRVEPEIFTSRVRPAMPGCGVGHPKVTVGTFGCLVRKKGKKRLYILSNSHVIANEGVAKKGDPVLQPGWMDGGRPPKDVIGRLEEWVPFQFSATGFPNLVDAAIARVAKSRVTDVIRIIGIAPSGVSTNIRRRMRVQKVGRTTDYTTGVVLDVHYRLSLSYMRPGGGTGRVGLRDQVLCSRYTQGGDSGSAVLNSRKRVVGLHFAGSPSTSIFNRIENVFNLLDLELA